jgi:ankyrin repeat protein
MKEDTENETIDTKFRTFLTGSKDADLIVLSKLNDEDLLNACQTNKTVAKACKNESFWKSRFIANFDNRFPVKPGYDYPSKYKKDFETWRNFYLKFIAYTDKYRINNNLLRIACFKGDLSLVVYILNNPKTDVNTPHHLPLITAAEGGYDDVIKYLINHGAIVTPPFLGWITAYGSFDIIKFVIEKKIDITIGNNLAIRTAGSSGRFDIVQYLIDAGANIHARNDEILLYAARHGNMKMVKYLLNHGANINRAPGSNFYPLPDSIKKGKMEVAKYLIQSGANVNIDNGKSLQNAIEYGNLEIVKDLVEHGANINIKFTDENITPLQLAKKNKEFEIYQYLKQFDK